MKRTLSVARPSLALLLASSMSTAALAGEVQVSWSAADSATGYRVHRGTASGDYDGATDVGDATTTTVEGLEDCRTWYFAITAYNGAGESGFSPEAATFPRAVPAAMVPPSAEPGSHFSVLVSGVNFRPGDAVGLSHPGVQIDALDVLSCYQISLSLSVAADAAPGAVDVVVTHPSGVSGTGAGLLAIVPPVPLAVLSTDPGDGQTNVPVGVMPTVQFTEAASGVTADNVRLLDQQGSPVAQAAGSPVVSPDGTVATLVPTNDLAYARTYRIQVLGGGAGPTDLDGNPLTDDFLQAFGFTTEADESAPVISGLTVGDIGGTTATVSWTTDEPADGRVYYRPQGGQAYTEVEDATPMTDHAIELTGLEPETIYEFHVTSTDVAGQTASSSPDESFVTGASPYDYLRFEAETGELTDPIAAATGVDAFSGGWIDTPTGATPGLPNDPLGIATYHVYVPTTGNWYLWARVRVEEAAADSWYESIDGATPEPLSAALPGGWTWVAGRGYWLDAGQHVVALGGAAAQAAADRLLLTNDPDFLPSEQPDVDVSAPEPVTAFEAQAAEGQIALVWSNPLAPDLERIVLRFRTDGPYPSSPVDGFPLIERPAAPGDAESFLHEGLAVGVEYRYAAFAVDAAGNASAAVQALGTLPGPPAPPSTIQVD